MIYLEGLESIAESIYLDENLDNRSGNCNIFVNPENIGYLVGKVVIINSPGYSEEKIEKLLENRCKIISRVKVSSKYKSRIEFCPYILRICMGVSWNGIDLDDFPRTGLSTLFENELCSFSTSDYVLHFPRIHSKDNTIDVDGNLTAYGWILQQVGVNIKEDTPFTNLDIIKSKKIVF